MLETQNRQAADVVGGPRAGTGFPISVLGWPGPALVNSLAPLQNLVTTSTEEGRTPSVTQYRTIQLGIDTGRYYVPSVVLDEPDLAVGRPQLSRPIGLDAAESLGVLFPVSLDNWNWPAQPVPHRRLAIDVAPDVRTVARRAGASGDVSAIGELCLRLVPDARSVLVTVTRDPEDGTTGLHFLVATTAPIEAVVAAEDQLHQFLFERVPAERRPLYTIGYDFGA